MNGFSLPVKYISVGFVIGFVALSAAAQTSKCLPADVKEDTVASFVTTTVKGIETKTPVTVKQILKRLKARCSRGKLVDRRGKAIYFYQLQGCWGTPPPGYQEIMEKQRTDLAALKKKFTVVEMTCNTSGVPQY